MYLLVYVDNIIIVSSCSQVVTALLHDLRSDFALKDLREFHYFLGILVKKLSDGLSLSQEQYASELLQHTGMTKCKPVKTPLVTSEKLSAKVGKELSSDEASRYRSIVGGLQYLMLTWPDVSFAVNKACQFLHAPTDVHMAAVK
jgi:hypothetical protein